MCLNVSVLGYWRFQKLAFPEGQALSSFQDKFHHVVYALVDFSPFHIFFKVLNCLDFPSVMLSTAVHLRVRVIANNTDQPTTTQCLDVLGLPTDWVQEQQQQQQQQHDYNAVHFKVQFSPRYQCYRSVLLTGIAKTITLFIVRINPDSYSNIKLFFPFSSLDRGVFFP